MLLIKEQRERLNDLFYILKLRDRHGNSSIDNMVKIEQVLAYLEVIHAEFRKISKKRKLVIIDSAAGNCYLSFLVSYFYSSIELREIEIHCLDINQNLMENKKQIAQEMGFNNMLFHTTDISDFVPDKAIDMVYSLHACGTATDKTMHLGVRSNAKIIMSVACCQHSLTMKSKSLKSVTRHKSFRDKILMMVSDSLRAMLLEKQGYKVTIFDFVSSRYTDKNVMVRAIKTSFKKNIDVNKEYNHIRNEFQIKPYLENLLIGS